MKSLNFRKFGKYDFKKIHPAGSLGAQLKTVEDIMLIKEKIPFFEEREILSHLKRLKRK